MSGEDILARVADAARRQRERTHDLRSKAARKGIVPARKARARRMAEAMKAKRAASPRSAWKRRPGVWRYGMAGRDRLLLSMEPGAWHSRRDLIEFAAGWDPPAPEGSVRAWVGKLLEVGAIDRAPNADYDATRFGRRQREPRWLYRRVAGAQDGGKGVGGV